MDRKRSESTRANGLLLGRLASIGFLLTSVTSAQAAMIAYTDPTAFTSAITNPTTLTFDNLTTPGNYLNVGESWFDQGVYFYNPIAIYLVNDQWGPNSPHLGFQFLVGHGGADLTITPPRGVTAISLETKSEALMPLMGYATINLSDGSHLDFSIPVNDTFGGPPSFLGLATTDPALTITSVIIPHTGYPDASYREVDLVSFTFATYVPEPLASRSLLGLGAVALLRWWKA